MPPKKPEPEITDLQRVMIIFGLLILLVLVWRQHRDTAFVWEGQIITCDNGWNTYRGEILYEQGKYIIFSGERSNVAEPTHWEPETNRVFEKEYCIRDGIPRKYKDMIKAYKEDR